MKTYLLAAAVLLYVQSQAQAQVDLGIKIVKIDKGALVTDVNDMSVGQNVGLLPNDIILVINGKRVESVEVLTKELRNSPDAILVWKRGAKCYQGGAIRKIVLKEIIVETSRGPEKQVIRVVVPVLSTGTQVDETSIPTTVVLGVDVATAPSGGATVTQVRDGFGKRIGLEPGDTILQVNGAKVDSVDALKTALSSRGSATLVWRRQGKYYRGDISSDLVGESTEIKRYQQVPIRAHEIDADVITGVALGIDVSDDPKGSRVEAVRDGLGQAMGLKPGDVIVLANGNQVSKPGALKQNLTTSSTAWIVWRRDDKYYRGAIRYELVTVRNVGERYSRVVLLEADVGSLGQSKSVSSQGDLTKP